MSTRLIIDGNAVYEIDEECERCMKQKKQPGGQRRKQGEKEDGEEREAKPENRR